ncbi:TonB-dependent receptor [Novosphingobium cyanobacteriorum]|uniref:TonB-dependent receptor n=1 Tax=Novosphingobium cyanobacteriorum TaxID=3024215 RepID=A0ABT6CIE2_9SPHN|nr:TonB-dependent receptor [Novosphingobium cyanobacteriorum]MDF8333682.1 TonB-dependent receptor [Novosphingobium cyanobacteriorum]
MLSRSRLPSFVAVLLAGVIIPCAANAQAATEHRMAIALPEQPLAAALAQLSLRTGVTVLASADVTAGKTAPAIAGTLTPEQAIRLLLVGTGLEAIRSGAGFAVRNSQYGGQVDERAQAAPVLDEILVTGTRIRGAAPAGANVIAITRTDIVHSGLATTQDVVAAIPQNFGGGANEGTLGFTQRNGATANIGVGASVNLRGLGASSTLTLVEGNRLALGAGASFVDLSLIPASAIEQIEVLADGTSAIYGSDAVAGVVNLRLRRSFEGAETSVRSGLANGFTEFQASQIAAAKWSRGRIMVAYEYYTRGRLGSEDRTYASEDLRPFGGPDYRQPYANPGTIIAADGSVWGIPQGQDGKALTPEKLLPGERRLGDGRIGTDLLPRTRRHAGVIALAQDLSHDVTLRLDGFAADRRSEQRYFALNAPVTVTSANPYYVDPIGTGEPVSVFYDFRKDLGAPLNKAHVKNWAVSGAIQARSGSWRGELWANLGIQHEELRALNVVNSARLAVALAQGDAGRAFNMFGDGSHSPAAVIDAVRGSAISRDRSRQIGTGFKVDGPLWSLPGGPLALAAGVEFRSEAFGASSIYDDYALEPVSSGDRGYPLGRRVVAGYAELRAPLVAPEQGIGGIRRLDVSIAGRIEHYSDFGTTANPKVGLTYEPFWGIALRGSWGTSFRAPGFYDTRQGPGLSQIVPLPLADPSASGGSSNVVALFGNNPAMGPERARTFTAGVDVRPPALPGLSLSMTWFDIGYRDRIANPAADAFTFLVQRQRYASLIAAAPSPATLEALYTAPDFFNPFGIPASAISYVIDARNANLARQHLDGMDFDLGYRTALPRGSISLGLSGTWLFHITQQLTRSAPAVEALGTIGNPVRYRLRGRLAADRDGFGLAVFLNHGAGYRNTAVDPVERVAGWTTLDLQASKAFGLETGGLSGTRLSLSVTNLFDQDPPYVNNRTPYSAVGFDPEQASAAGRVIAVQLVKSW